MSTQDTEGLHAGDAARFEQYLSMKRRQVEQFNWIQVDVIAGEPIVCILEPQMDAPTDAFAEFYLMDTKFTIACKLERLGFTSGNVEFSIKAVDANGRPALVWSAKLTK